MSLASFTKEEVYQPRHGGRGRALIIANDTFTDGSSTRDGNQADVRNILSVLKKLQVSDTDIKLCQNKTARQMKAFIEQESNDPDLEEVDFLICFIMSHGCKGGNIVGSDGNYFNLKVFGDLFNRDNCPSLKGKAKIIITQACRGSVAEPDEKIYDTDAVSGQTTLPLMTDFFFAFGSEEDYVSFRDVTDGSIFIQAVCFILEQHWRRRSLLSMMTMVNSHVADQVMRYEEGGIVKKCKQTANFKSSLRKEFFFYHEGMYYLTSTHPPSSLKTKYGYL